MREYEKSASYERNERTVKNGEDPCVVCGRGTARDWTHVVHLHDGGGQLVQEGEAEALGLSEASDVGWFPIGPDCAKKVRAYVYTWNGGEVAPAFPDEHAREAAHLVKARAAEAQGKTLASREAHETLARLIAKDLAASPRTPAKATRKPAKRRAKAPPSVADTVAAQLTADAIARIPKGAWKDLEKRVEALAIAASVYGGARLRYAATRGPMLTHQREVAEACADFEAAVAAIAAIAEA